jgi:methyl-accepting chemotaxis protein
LKRQGEDFRLVEGKLVAGANALNGRSDIVDRVQDLVGGVATIFMGDLRVATNVKKPDGSRAVGTKLAAGPVYDALFKRGEAYRGEADILGRSYFTAYDPIRDAKGGVVGILFVGQLEAETHAEIAGIQTWAISVALGVALAVGALMLALSSRMFAPLVRLRQSMTSFARGDLESAVEGLSRGDDIGEMARAVDALRAAALEKIRLDQQNERQRREGEAERSENERALQQRGQERAQALEALTQALQQVAAGDLTVALGDRLPEVYRRLCEDFDAAVSSLARTMAEVRGGAEAVSGSAAELAASSDSLSRRTENDASRLDETAGALNSLRVKAQRSIELASVARKAAMQADAEAKSGGEVARGACEAMRRIEASSREISDILGLINEIAFQTSLLALNAGVEAARAGEAGRGFAVVAAEVRALANRSGEAAKQIASLVAASNGEVAGGVARVEATQQALGRITARVAEVEAGIGEIAGGAGEQSRGLDELDAAVAALSKSVQENAAMAEQSNAAGSALTQEAERLAHAIHAFRLHDYEPQRDWALTG